MPETLPVPPEWAHMAPGVIALLRLYRGDREKAALCLARSQLMECAKQLLGEGAACDLSWADGVLVYLNCSKKTAEPAMPTDVPEATRIHARRLVDALKAARLRVSRYVSDGELLHIIVTAGCGTAAVTVAPDGTVTVSDAENVDVEVEREGDGYRVYAVCREKPPYLRLEKYLLE